MAERSRRTVVLGLGNPLMGDDGLGIAAVERLRDEWYFDDRVCLEDGGTWGLNLLPAIEDATHLILIDAIDSGMPAGTEIVLDRSEIPRYLGHKLSPHQIDLREVLAIAELRGTLPADTVAIGLQPERIEMVTSLSPPLERALDRLVALAADQLRAWGHTASPQRRRASA